MGYFAEIVTSRYEILLSSILIALCVYLLVSKRKYKLPPGPRGLPIVGYLPYMGNDPVAALKKLSQTYGDTFSLYLGRKLIVVVTDSADAKQLLNLQSSADRPEDLFMFLTGGGGFGDSNGEKWIEQRRYTIKEMKNLGFGKSDWETLVAVEVNDFLDILKKSGGQPTDIYNELSASISNNVLSLVSNQRLPAGHPKRKIIDQGIESFQLIYDQSGLISNFPKLFKLCAELGLIKAGEKLKDIENMHICIRQRIEELEREKDGDSFIHKYFAEIEKNKQQNLGNHFTVEMLIGNVQALIIAGSDTTKVSLLWLFLAMAAFPQIQEKVYEEVDTVLGKDGKADWVDRNKLPYCHATIMEGQRWRTVAPLNLLHRTNEDIVFNGYDIPKGACIMSPISAYHDSTKHWKDPDTFQPERFLVEDGKKVTEPEGYLPFSHGKRVCPGKTIALIEIFHYFVAIVQKFRILPASENRRPDLEGHLGLTLQPKRQSLRFVLR